MRPTTKDLAQAAGVSLATVDRVLNERPGVRKNTVVRVNQAIEKIGFTRNLAAASLARGKNFRFLFLLPRRGDLFLQELIAQIYEANSAFAAEMIRVEVVPISDDDPYKIAQLLAAYEPDMVDGIAIMAAETPQTRDAKARLIERGIEAVSFISGPGTSDNVHFVGIDNRAAGATAGRLMGRFSSARTGKILVIAETMLARDSLERRLGFDAVINTDYPRLIVLPSLETYGDSDRAARIIGASFANHPDIVGVYVPSSESRLPLTHLANQMTNQKPVIVAHERTTYNEDGLRSDQIDALITQDTGHLVRSAIRILRAKCDRRHILASQERIRIEILLKENI
jgi:LacI family transcriptional regulator